MISLRRVAKLALLPVAVLELLFAVGIVYSWHGHTSWYRKIWGAKIKVAGVASSESALYLEIGRSCGGVLMRKSAAGYETYALDFGNCENLWFLWRCESYGYSFLPGFAYSNHKQWTNACMSPNVGVANSSSKIFADPKYGRPRKEVFSKRSVEFTADDGKRVRVEW